MLFRSAIGEQGIIALTIVILVALFLIQSRGTGRVSFEPDQIKPWEDTRAGANSPWAPIWVPPAMPADGRVPVKVTFNDPGTYIIRALADDGALTGGDSITVTVTK